jgi:hypothetical protein
MRGVWTPPEFVLPNRLAGAHNVHAYRHGGGTASTWVAVTDREVVLIMP